MFRMHNKAALVEAVGYPVMSCISFPSLTDAVECADHASMVNVLFGVLGKEGIVPDPMVQSGYHYCCRGNPDVHLRINDE